MALRDKFETEGSDLNPLKGTLPKAALKDAGTVNLNDTFGKGRYQDYVLDTEKAIDLTGGAQTRTQG